MPSFNFNSQGFVSQLVVMKSQTDWDYVLSMLNTPGYTMSVVATYTFPNVPYDNISLVPTDKEAYISTSTMPDGRTKITVNTVDPKRQYSLRWSSTTEECLISHAAASMVYFKNIPVYAVIFKQDALVTGGKKQARRSLKMNQKEAKSTQVKATKAKKVIG